MRNKRHEELEAQARVIVDKMQLVTSQTAIKYMEGDLLKVEQQIKDLEARKDEQETKGGVDMETILTYIKYFVEHLRELLIDHSNPILRARYFWRFVRQGSKLRGIRLWNTWKRKNSRGQRAFQDRFIWNVFVGAQGGNVRKRTLRPNRVRVQFHDVVITKDKAEDEPRLYLWCARRESNPHDFWSRDFKSLASTYSATRAYLI